MFIKFLTQIQLSTSSKIKMHLYQNPQDSNGLVGSLGLGFGFRFEGAQIQILCLGKLKEMDLDWFKIQLEFDRPKSRISNFSHSGIWRSLMHIVLYFFVGSFLFVSLFLATTHKLFFPLSLSLGNFKFVFLNSYDLSSSLTSLILSFY